MLPSTKRLLETKPVDVALPAGVLYELEVGVLRSEAPGRRRQQLATPLDAIRVLSFGSAEARVAARIGRNSSGPARGSALWIR